MLRFSAALVWSLAFVAACSDDPAPQTVPVGANAEDGSPTAGSPGALTPVNGPVSNGGGNGPGPNVSPNGTPNVTDGPASVPPAVQPNGTVPPTTGTPLTPPTSNNPPPVMPPVNNGGAGPGPNGPNPSGGNGPAPVDSPVGLGGAPVGNGGSTAMAGATAMGGSGPDLDVNGKPNAKPGDMTSTPQDYLRLGEIRILNNNWGSEDLGCNANMSVFVNADRSFGWTFNRGDCDTANSNQKPDFPQIEFGIHPFGIGSDLVTSPEFSSTTLLPRQIKDITSASVSIQNLNVSMQQESSWNITFEFWISERDPVNDPSPGVYAELMTFWGWQSGRWPEPPNGTGPTGNGAGDKVTAGKTYTLWVQDDNWASGWRYFQFRADDGPQRSFNGTLDVKPLIDYLVNSRGYSKDFWVTRLEVGSEIDDNTAGTVTMSGITFEVNGESRAATLGE